VLEHCDRQSVRAYLDTTTTRNKRLYERHGFQAEDPFASRGGAAPVADVATAGLGSVASSAVGAEIRGCAGVAEKVPA
jgi:hypothetical protein